jgi:signal peptidase I
VVEAFKIPTGSMIPTLDVGDHIFVNKFIYGLRVPLTNAWFAAWGSPDRGDVIVFRYPRDLSKDYIKRVIAVAGDRVRVAGQDVFVNGEKLPRAPRPDHRYVEEGEGGPDPDDVPDFFVHSAAFEERSRAGEQRYTVLYDRSASRLPWPSGGRLPGLRCSEPVPGTPAECVVEPEHVFVMGDNRDNSSDGRVWGAVPHAYVKGKALFVWWSRGPRSGVRWGRIGQAVH